jgi:hypothetical protein
MTHAQSLATRSILKILLAISLCAGNALAQENPPPAAAGNGSQSVPASAASTVAQTAAETPAETLKRSWQSLTDSVQDAKHTETRTQALDALSSLGWSRRADGLIAAAMKDPNLDVRTAAILAAGKTKSHSLIEPVRKLLDDAEPEVVLAAFLMPATGVCAAQDHNNYEPTLASLDSHPLPGWYAGAKLGIFIHWGLYSVPGWAPLSHHEHDFTNVDYIKNNPYAEWYLNVMRIPGSQTQAYHDEHYGANFSYYDFAPIFNRESKKWNPDEWARTFHDAGARYVVLTTKHHEGFTLWPSTTMNPNPSIPQNERHAERDIVGELTAAVRKNEMKMGLYYSGGYDWTFNSGPIETPQDYESVKPETKGYGDYAFAQIHELIDRYHPAVTRTTAFKPLEATPWMSWTQSVPGMPSPRGCCTGLISAGCRSVLQRSQMLWEQ